ncbi:hypothetical protein D3C81_1766410 [compost metagenome]
MRSRQAIVKALTDALLSTGVSLASLAPFQVSTIARLSGFQLATVASNWHHLEAELLELAKLPPKPVFLHIIDDGV